MNCHYFLFGLMKPSLDASSVSPATAASSASSLNATQRQRLRALGHALHPLVLIGDQGLTDAVLKEIDVHLNAHGLIKLRAGGAEREAREAMLAEMCEKLNAHPIHHMGKVLMIYRRPADSQRDPLNTHASHAPVKSGNPGAPGRGPIARGTYNGGGARVGLRKSARGR